MGSLYVYFTSLSIFTLSRFLPYKREINGDGAWKKRVQEIPCVFAVSIYSSTILDCLNTDELEWIYSGKMTWARLPANSARVFSARRLIWSRILESAAYCNQILLVPFYRYDFFNIGWAVYKKQDKSVIKKGLYWGLSFFSILQIPTHHASFDVYKKREVSQAEMLEI